MLCGTMISFAVRNNFSVNIGALFHYRHLIQQDWTSIIGVARLLLQVAEDTGSPKLQADEVGVAEIECLPHTSKTSIFCSS